MNVTKRIFAVVVLAVACLTSLVHGQTAKLPPFADVQQLVDSFFQATKQRPADIISKSQVDEVLAILKDAGWDISDKQEILDAALDDQHILVSTLRTPAGVRFMSKIGTRELMYDRLDRVSQVSGGPELIRDLVKLPNGEKYAKPKSGGGVPDLLDLLPKNSSGKTRRIADYHKPTGHLYTAPQLVARLAESYKKDSAKSSQ